MKFRIALLAGTSLLLAAPGAQAGHIHPEAYYQKKWCDAHNGKMEVVVNGIRVDCLDGKRATEHDFPGEARRAAIHRQGKAGARFLQNAG